MPHITVYLDAQPQGAQGVLVGTAQGGHGVVMQQPEMAHLMLRLVQALAEHGEQVVALVQLPFQGNQVHGVAQGIPLQGRGVAFQHGIECSRALASLMVRAARDTQGVIGRAFEEALDQAAYRAFAELAGPRELIHLQCSFEYRPQGQYLLFGRGHGASSKAGTACSITPPPRHTSSWYSTTDWPGVTARCGSSKRIR